MKLIVDKKVEFMAKKTIVAAAISLFVFVLIAILTVTGRLDGANASFMDWTYALETPSLTLILKIITYISEWFVYVPIALLLIAIPRLRWRFGIPASITLATSAVLNVLLKQCFAIPRPDIHRLITETGFSFPSGHAMNGVAFIGICVLLFMRYSSIKAHKAIISVFAVLFLLAVGFSRVYLGVHNLTDIIAGYAMGLSLCLCTAGIPVKGR